MSQSTPVCSLFCSKCKRESAKSLRHYDRDHSRNYLNVVVLSTARGGNAALCKCKRCGYTYISKSMAAKRAMRHLSNAKLTHEAGGESL